MNGSIFWRVVWKEYRLQRGFWFSMVVIGVLLELLVLVCSPESTPDDRATWLFDMALVVWALYALGCGATLFAVEHETGTYEFQRTLPVSAAQLLFGKLTFGVLSSAALLGLLSVSAALLAGGRLPSPDACLQMWALWGFLGVELFVWGTFFSLVLKRPLGAAILGVVATGVSLEIIALVSLSGPRSFYGPVVNALAGRVAWTAIVALVTIGLGLRWLREKAVARRARPFPPVDETSSLAVLAECGSFRLRGGAFVHLVWQHGRQSLGMLLILSAMAAPLFLGLVWTWASRTEPLVSRSVTASNSPVFGMAVGLALFAAPLAGACVFLADQRQHCFRFLAERGVNPRSVWLSRQLVWLVPTLAWTTLILTVMLLAGVPSFSAHRVALELGMALGFVILAYAAGQLCSLFFTGGIMAAVFGVILTALCWLWAGLVFFLGVPWIWSVAPIPLVFLWSTWLRTPSWLLERNTLRGWLPTALALAVPLLAIATAVGAYRVYSIPAADPGFDPEAFAVPASAEARKTVDMYRRALDLYEPLPAKNPETDEVWTVSGPGEPLTEADLWLLDHNEKSLDLTLEATRRPDCDFFDPTGRLMEGRPGSASSAKLGFSSLGDLLVTGARRLESQGEVDAALDRYLAAVRFAAHLRVRTADPLIADDVERRVYRFLPYWAAHADQTPERIRDAIERLGALQKSMAPPTDAIKSDYLRVERVIEGDLDAALIGDRFCPTAAEAFVLYAVQWMPWERARARRLLDLFTAAEMELLEGVLKAVRRNEPPPSPRDPFAGPRWKAMKLNTVVLGFAYSETARGLADSHIRTETCRRAVRVQLALAGRRLEHGELPERLDKLEGAFLKQVPRDPYTGRPFRYFPEGKPQPTRDEEPWRQEPAADTIVPAGKPFFESAGRDRRLSPFEGYRGAEYRSDRDVVFEIPLAP